MTFFGIPREEIKWYPKIDYDKCVNCKTCLKFCPNGVYGEEGEKRVVVVQPYNCVVGCSACALNCPRGAIIFPSRKELNEMLRSLYKKYGYI